MGRWRMQRWFVQGCDQPRRKRLMVPSLLALLALVAVGMLSAMLSACGASTQPVPPAPSSSYTSVEYHFSLSYPAGWVKTSECIYWDSQTFQCDTSPPANAPRMGLVTIAYQQSGQSGNSDGLVSNLTIEVLDLSNPHLIGKDLMQAITTRATNSSYHAVTLAGRTAYATKPVQQPIYGSQQFATHTDYYLVANSFQYHLSTDSLASDHADAAIQGMLASFTLTS